MEQPKPVERPSEKPVEQPKPVEPPKPDVKPDTPATAEGGYSLHDHPVYGKYIDASEFGTDHTGKTDSLHAIQEALRAAEKESLALKAANPDAKGVFVHLKGTLYISDQIVIDKKVGHIGGLFGDGMVGRSQNGQGTEIRFDKVQEGVFNSNTNEMDIHRDSGVLVDGVDGVTIANLSVKYTADDFYREGYSYFGKVNGIMVNDADHTTIRSVEVSGANRAGVFFSSTKTLEKDPHSATGRTFKGRRILGEVDEDYEHLPYGEHNRLEDSYLHHNRVAGAMFGYQKDFTADNNVLERNGHEADGGTGYGIASMAGSYNHGITFTNNKTDHNYRKGLDIHDGNHITIANNQSNGDRLYGIGVYNRQFVMDDVRIKGNTIVQDADFRLEKDDGNRDNFPYEVIYHGYSAIQLMTNTQFRDFKSDVPGKFTVSGNTIKGLDVYKDNMQTFGIEFRNHESKTNYRVDIVDNTLEGKSTKSLIAVINNTKNRVTGELGEGIGTVNISGNKAHIDEISAGRSAIVVAEDKETHVNSLRGSVTIKDNEIEIGKENYGETEAIYVRGNAEHYDISGNELTSNGEAQHSFIVVNNDTTHKATVEINGNHLHSTTWDGHTGGLWPRWLTKAGGEVALQSADGNTHNGAKAPLLSTYQAEVDSHKAKLTLALEKHDAHEVGLIDSGSKLSLSDLLSPDGFAGSSILSDFNGNQGALSYASDAALNNQVLPSMEGLQIL